MPPPAFIRSFTVTTSIRDQLLISCRPT